MREAQSEGYTFFLIGTKCYKWFCIDKPVFRKMIIKFPVIIRYVPACERHK